MRKDLWFCRFDGRLYAVTCEPGEPPSHMPVAVDDVGATIRRVQKKGYEITQVGILPPEMIGLE